MSEKIFTNKKSTVTVILLLLTLYAPSQNIKISISNPAAPDGTKVWFCRSIDGDPVNYVMFYDMAQFYKGSALKTFNIDTTMFIVIADNPFVPKTRMVICKGDSIHLEIRHDSLYTDNRIVFTGANAKGHENYYANDLFLNSITQHSIFKTLSDAKNDAEAISKTEQLKKDLFKPMDSLYSVALITKDYYTYVTLEADAEFLCAVLAVTNMNLFQLENGKSVLKLNSYQLRKLQKHYYSTYDPFADKYRNVNYRNTNIRHICKLIESGLIKPPFPYQDLGLWDKNELANNYAPANVQENMYATTLIAEQKFGAISEEQAHNKFNRFKKAFPTSIFLPVIESRFTNSNTINPSTYGIYDASTKQFTTVSSVTIPSLPDLINKYFATRPVLLDIWATWCSPCKKEFAYARKVQKFLNGHETDLLYVSVDYADNAKGWMDDIYQYALEGHHYFATNAAFTYLTSILNISPAIPQYVLFPGNGRPPIIGLPRPSEGEQLFEKLVQYLKKTD